MHPRVSIDAYGRVLQVFLGLYATLEPLIQEASERLTLRLDMNVRQRLPALVDDLEHLDGFASGPACDLTMPALASAAELLGWIYVLEGSTLGSQMISRHVKRHLDVAPGRGLSFFHGQGADTYAQWGEVCTLLEAHGTTPEARAAMVDAARQAFATFQAWFDLQLPVQERLQA